MKQIISFQIDSDILESIKKDAEAEGISASAIIRRLLIQYYRKGQSTNEYKERQNPTTARTDSR